MAQFRIKNGLIIDNGGISVTGSISSTAGITGSFSGSIAGFPTDVSSFSSSLSTRITSTEATASEYVASSGSLSTRTTAVEATSSQYVAASSSFSTRTTNAENYISAINAKTGSYATTGSNYFIGNQVITGSVYIANDLIVQGSSSLQNITASAVSIGTNTVILNTSTPILRFGGISVQDSGSTQGRSGSLYWDSVHDHWIYVVPSGSTEGYNSAMLMNGPKNTGSLGDEAGLTTNYIPIAQGEDHIADSIMYQSGSNIGIGITTPTYKLDVNGTLITRVTSSVYNASFVNSLTDALAAISINATDTSTSGINSGSAALELVGRADNSSHGRHAWIGAEGVIGQTYRTRVKFKVRGESNTGYTWANPNAEAPTIMTLDGNGYVGIGSSAPTVALDVAGVMRLTHTSSVSILLNKNTATAGASAQLYFHDQGVGKWDLGAFNMGAAGVNDFSIYNRSGSGSNPITILYANSNVGIGTVNPGAKLEVWQSTNNRLLVNYVNISNEPQISSLDSSNNPQYLTINSYDLKLKTNGTTALTLSSTQTATFASTVTATGAVRSIHSGVDATFADAFIGVYSGNNNEQNAIQTSVSSVAESSGFRFQASNGGGSTGRTNVVDFRRDRALFYTSVGVGTTGPTNKLHVVDTNPMIRVSYSSGGDARYAELGHGALIAYAGATNNWLTIGFSGGGTPSSGLPNGSVQFSTNGSARMTVAKDGNVGIGTDIPTKKLEVNGKIGTPTVVSGNIVAGNISSNISTSPSFILICDLNNAAGFSLSGKVNAASYTCWNISDIWIKKDYSSTVSAAGITGSYKSGCDFSIVDCNYGGDRFIALRFTGNPEIDVMWTGYRLHALFAADGSATVVTGATVNSTLASY